MVDATSRGWSPEKRRANTMYRYLLVLLCPVVAPAPQTISDSDITYVRAQPPVEGVKAPSHFRESRIETLPLTIPGNLTFGRLLENTAEKREATAGKSEVDESTSNADSETIFTEGSDLTETVVLPDGGDRTFPGDTNLEITEKDVPGSADLAEGTELVERTVKPDSTEISERTLSDTESSARTQSSEDDKTDLLGTTGIPVRNDSIDRANLPGNTNLSTNSNLPDPPIPDKTDDELLEAHGSDTDTVPSETLQSERRGRTYESDETTDIFEEVTERYEEILPYEIEAPKVFENAVNILPPRTRTLPKYVPKLSYFPKPRPFVAVSANSLEKSGKRRFRSNCRCEKIWNCQKLQISVARCPDEYFLCCF